MYINRIKMLSIFVIIVLAISGCNKSEDNSSDILENAKDFYDNGKDIYIDVVCGEVMEIDLSFVTEEKVEKVEFVSFEGENVPQNPKVDCIYSAVEECRDHVYRGMYFSSWMFSMEPMDKELEYTIDAMTILVNDETRIVKFENPIKKRSGAANDIYRGDLQIKIFASGFESAWINEEKEVFTELYVNENLVIDNVYYKNDMKVNVEVEVNNSGVIEKLPVEVKKVDVIHFNLSFESEVYDKYDQVYTNLYFDYTLDGEKYTKNGTTVFHPTNPADTELKVIDEFIEYIINEE